MRPRLLLIAVSLLLAAAGASAQDRLYSNAFPLGDVKLLDGPLKTARDLNLEVLMQALPPKMRVKGRAKTIRPVIMTRAINTFISANILKR